MLLTILIASFAGALAGLTMMLLKRLRGDHHIPFGPFLAVGLLVSVVWGDAMVTWYLQVTERFFLP
jgi:prepilin signal peptidase PulO-like enzyme (type II secretory pathway)